MYLIGSVHEFDNHKSCGARRMVESAALLVNEVLPQQPMRQWVLTVPFPLRFLFASQPTIIGKALGIVYRTIATHLTHKAGYKNSTAHTGAELTQLTHTIAHRLARYLERQGLLVRDAEHSYLALDSSDEDPTAGNVAGLLRASCPQWFLPTTAHGRSVNR